MSLSTAVTERIGTPSTVTTSTTNTPVTSSPLPAPPAVTSANCAVCNMSGATRTVSRSRAVHYGLKEDAVGARVCEPCHCRCVRSRYTRCPVPTCPGPRVRAKRLRHLPPRWHDLPLDLKRPLMDEFQIPSELSKCCLACFKRITRRLEGVGEAAPEPSEEEAARFRALLRDHGTAWDRMAAQAARPPASLKAFYFTYRKRFQLDALVAERPPAKGSESDSSVVSSGDTDTASAESPRPPPLPGPRTDAVAPKGRRRDEYDSSATETADEENETPTAKIIPSITLSTPVSSTAPPTPPLSTATATATATAAPAGVSVSRNGPGAQLTVRDVVLNMIEISLSRPTPPKLMQPKLPTTTAPREQQQLATLSVVNSSHVGVASPVSPQRPATITPLAQAPAMDTPKEGVVVLIEPRERQEPLLDLSVKRPRMEQPPPQQSLAKPPYRNSMDYQQYRQAERESPTQYNCKPKPVSVQPRPAGKPTPNKGSITLGTPVETRFDPRRTPPETKGGSITAGTPVHTHHIPEKKSFDYYKRRSPGGPAYYAGVQGQPRPQSPSSFSPQNAGGYTGRPYAVDNRQIIMTDYITSQQMHTAARRQPERDPRAQPERQDRLERPEQQRQTDRSSSPQYSASARREPVSVITRHASSHVYPHPQMPPGHESFISLVDVAASATALPVPQQERKPEKQHHHHHQDMRISMRDMTRDMAMAQVVQAHAQAAHAQAAQAAQAQAQAQARHHAHTQMSHSQHYQMERDRQRQQQASYNMERDRQAIMQQNRDRERAMAERTMAERAMAERHIALEQHHQSQLMQERQHQLALSQVTAYTYQTLDKNDG
ncbi:hypothetical protein O0L34_g14943 [Tuta absoluta]|nr:hypothetical protein O0L34_g14943 [Tuta absoluta]